MLFPFRFILMFACLTGERVKVSELLHKQIHDKDLVVDREERLKAELEVGPKIIFNLYSHKRLCKVKKIQKIQKNLDRAHTTKLFFGNPLLTWKETQIIITNNL